MRRAGLSASAELLVLSGRLRATGAQRRRWIVLASKELVFAMRVSATLPQLIFAFFVSDGFRRRCQRTSLKSKKAYTVRLLFQSLCDSQQMDKAKRLQARPRCTQNVKEYITQHDFFLGNSSL